MKKLGLCMLALFLITESQGQSCDKYNEAKTAYEYFMSGYETIRTLEHDELQNLVKAICEAEEEEQESVSKDAAYRVESMVHSNIDKLEKDKEKADDLIKEVLNNSDCSSYQSEVSGWQSRMSEIWGRIERMENRVQAGNNPVTTITNKIGKDAHNVYQSDNSSKGLKEVTLSSGRADFVMNADNGCIVVEVKPNNYKAISKGRGQVNGYTDDLNNNRSSNFTDLVNKDAKFKDCEGKFKPLIVCYTYCPEVMMDGEVKSTSYQWSNCGP
jgi:hypothetical protein